MNYVPVKAVSVFLWGKRVGVIVHAYDQYSRFEYDPENLPPDLSIGSSSSLLLACRPRGRTSTLSI